MMILSLNLILVLVAFFHSIPSTISTPAYYGRSSGDFRSPLMAHLGDGLPLQVSPDVIAAALERAQRKAEAEAEVSADGRMRIATPTFRKAGSDSKARDAEWTSARNQRKAEAAAAYHANGRSAKAATAEKVHPEEFKVEPYRSPSMELTSKLLGNIYYYANNPHRFLQYLRGAR
ncbi:hypothetical protein PSTG_15682 [Puccinia striiformis f. sp. tritici PST-78]|uniref:Secreted protein n=2 Tax=Puccinia striiformis TaxID=27350 RepID=A0A0L0UV24_9BASI|nr:hypothetical protein PSTG_15682 [Puccinia striiformis f. sp. tritici PST-78]